MRKSEREKKNSTSTSTSTSTITYYNFNESLNKSRAGQKIVTTYDETVGLTCWLASGLSGWLAGWIACAAQLHNSVYNIALTLKAHEKS